MGTPVATTSDNTEATTGKHNYVTRRFIVNKLNYINFQNRTVQVNLRHVKYDNTTILLASPLPCSGELLECSWEEPSELGTLLRTHRFQNLLILDEEKLYLVTPKVLRLDESGMSLQLPENGCEVFSRKICRHPCVGIAVRFIQNSILFTGFLADFNPVSFRIKLELSPDQTFRWIDGETTAVIILEAEGSLLYSGECRIIRHDAGQSRRDYVLEPIDNGNRRRFRPKKYRSTRQELIPAPTIEFRHPFTRRKITLKILDISGGGFSVEETSRVSVLLPGMILPEIELNFAGSFRITCRCQVIYRNPVETTGEESLVKCGIAILNMDANDHLKLLSLRQQAANRKSYIGASVEMDALWNFFFASGFVYPEKYAYFESNKEEIKRLYDKLYDQSPHIARHFIYQDRGVILGHMAMIRFFENSWLIHHHAASKNESMRAGVAVLNQIGQFINDSHAIGSLRMNYVLCYFRPDNKFPDRIFGGLARNLKAPRECSLDTFAYFHFHPEAQPAEELPSTWLIEPADIDDLRELSRFYRHTSGGLMLDAVDLTPDTATCRKLTDEYRKLGFKKERYLYSLKKEGELKAFAMVNISDIGLNMSNLTNCPTIIILGDEVNKVILSRFLSCIAVKYDGNELPVLLYPATHAMKCSVSTEKLYTLWVLDMQYTDHYFRYLENLIKHIQL